MFSLITRNHDEGILGNNLFESRTKREREREANILRFLFFIFNLLFPCKRRRREPRISSVVDEATILFVVFETL